MATPNRIAPDSRRHLIRLPRPVRIGLGTVGGLVVFIIAAGRLFHSLDGPPFQLVIEPDGDNHATVQFTQAGRGLTSKSFRIDGHIEKRDVVVLDSPAAAIPGGHIEFADTTLLPGRFTIRLGQIVFDVMVGGIRVDGRFSEWLHVDQMRQ
jgi:hypothetical protein